jgi:hypothetical protein
MASFASWTLVCSASGSTEVMKKSEVELPTFWHRSSILQHADEAGTSSEFVGLVSAAAVGVCLLQLSLGPTVLLVLQTVTLDARRALRVVCSMTQLQSKQTKACSTCLNVTHELV